MDRFCQKLDQSILDVRSITHDAVTDSAEATFTDPMGTNTKTSVKSDLVVRGRGHVHSHFSTIPTIYLWIDCVQNWSIDPGCEVNFAWYGHQQRSSHVHRPDGYLYEVTGDK